MSKPAQIKIKFNALRAEHRDCDHDCLPWCHFGPPHFPMTDDLDVKASIQRRAAAEAAKMHELSRLRQRALQASGTDMLSH